MQSGQWIYNDTISYDINIPDTTICGELTIGIRHNNNYPYRNIWIELTHCDSNAIIHSIDTVNIELCDVYGKWHGNGVGSSYQISYILPKSITISSKDKLQLRHIMRIDTLHGIEQLGFILNRANL